MTYITNKIKEELTKLSKLAITLGTAGAITAGLMCAGSCSDKRNLTEQDFKNAIWYRTYNFNRPLSDYFNNEDVYPSAENRELYEKIVKERNNGQVTGWIGVPDLNQDNVVGANRAVRGQLGPRP